MSTSPEKAALALFNRSPIKQQKWCTITQLLPAQSELQDKECLDLGSDNGVISLLLRKYGGRWSSADIEERTVTMITQLVGERVFLVDKLGENLTSNSFDLIVIVDMLEHLESDQAFVRNVARALRPGGSLIVNVPNPVPGIWRRFRFMLGQTDLAHGHLRPGYSLHELRELIGPELPLEYHLSYSKLFSELCDTIVTFGMDLVKGGKSGEKGRVIDAGAVSKQRKLFLIYSLLYPFLKFAVWCDRLLFWQPGNMLIARFRKT